MLLAAEVPRRLLERDPFQCVDDVDARDAEPRLKFALIRTKWSLHLSSVPHPVWL